MVILVEQLGESSKYCDDGCGGGGSVACRSQAGGDDAFGWKLTGECGTSRCNIKGTANDFLPSIIRHGFLLQYHGSM